MFAIAFDMDIKELRTTYGEPYNNAYYEIKILLRKYDFYNTQGSVYLTDKDDMANLFAAIYALKKIVWFKASVRDIRAFKVENWSDFTQIVKGDDWRQESGGQVAWFARLSDHGPVPLIPTALNEFKDTEGKSVLIRGIRAKIIEIFCGNIW